LVRRDEMHPFFLRFLITAVQPVFHYSNYVCVSLLTDTITYKLNELKSETWSPIRGTTRGVYKAHAWVWENQVWSTGGGVTVTNISVWARVIIVAVCCTVQSPPQGTSPRELAA
jgi:hypothetical protein